MHGGYPARDADGDRYLSPAAADDGPYFFLSYAHAPRDFPVGRDPDLWIAQLYDDLCEHIKSLADLAPGKKAGFMDRELQQGHEWPRHLSQALATCHVFVPLYSRRYFKSEHCGREWFAFNRRRLNYRARSARPIETIVPALWIPVRDGLFPEAASAVQYNSADFGQLYAEHGFYGIMKVSRWREAYEEAVYLLARRIVDAAEASPPIEPEVWTEYESLPSAFGGLGGTGPGDKLLRLTVIAPERDELPGGRDPAYYGENVREWNPFRPDSLRALADHAGDLARGLSYTPDVGDLYRHESALFGRAAVGARGAADRPVGGDAAGVPADAPAARRDGQAVGPGRRGVEPQGRADAGGRAATAVGTRGSAAPHAARGQGDIGARRARRSLARGLRRGVPRRYSPPRDGSTSGCASARIAAANDADRATLRHPWSAQMADDMTAEGKIVTFYSYKGGTGRTMALANVAWILASNGLQGARRRLGPRLARPAPVLPPVPRPREDRGHARRHRADQRLRLGRRRATRSRPADWHRHYAQILPHAISLNWQTSPAAATLDFVSAGRQNRDYSSSRRPRSTGTTSTTGSTAGSSSTRCART